jgi:hypothetical protein
MNFYDNNASTNHSVTSASLFTTLDGPTYSPARPAALSKLNDAIIISEMTKMNEKPQPKKNMSLFDFFKRQATNIRVKSNTYSSLASIQTSASPSTFGPSPIAAFEELARKESAIAKAALNSSFGNGSVTSNSVFSTASNSTRPRSKDGLSRDAHDVLGSLRQQREALQARKLKQVSRANKVTPKSTSNLDFLGSLLVFPAADTAVDRVKQQEKNLTEATRQVLPTDVAWTKINGNSRPDNKLPIGPTRVSHACNNPTTISLDSPESSTSSSHDSGNNLMSPSLLQVYGNHSDPQQSRRSKGAHELQQSLVGARQDQRRMLEPPETYDDGNKKPAVNVGGEVLHRGCSEPCVVGLDLNDCSNTTSIQGSQSEFTFAVIGDDYYGNGSDGAQHPYDELPELQKQ